jgi:hypothetical protein
VCFYYRHAIKCVIHAEKKTQSSFQKDLLIPLLQLFLVAMAPSTTNEANRIETLNGNKNATEVRTTSTFVPTSKSLNEQIPTRMVLTTNSAQLTSKNNNRTLLKEKRRSASTIITKTGTPSIQTGMTLRSRTILIG